MEGYGFLDDKFDRGRRTNVLEQEAESREKVRDAQIASLESALLNAQMERAQQWDYRSEAPVVAEGPSTKQPQQVPGSETAIPKTQQMPVYAEGESSESEGVGKAPPGGPVSEGGGTGMPGFANSPVPIIQGTEIPGDRFPRVPVAGGSMLEQPRSYYQGKENLEKGHTELYGDPMPGVSGAIAQGLQPYKPPAGRRSIEDELYLHEEKARIDERYEGPDATDRNRDWKVGDSAAQRYFSLALEANGGDADAANEATRQAHPNATWDINKGVSMVNSRRMRQDRAARTLGMPPHAVGWWAFDQIMDFGFGVDEVVAILEISPETREVAPAIKAWLGNDDKMEMMRLFFDRLGIEGTEEPGG